MWLAQRLHRIPEGKPQFVPWAGLFEQFGQNYKEVRFFRRDFLTTLKQVTATYPDARIEVDGKGMFLSNSPPPISKRLALT